MISMEDWVTIRNLKRRRPDLGTRSIARLVGVSRSTVKRALSSNQFQRYKREKKVNEFIEPFREYIKDCYLVKRQRVSVIFENLRSKGFMGNRISLYRYIWEYLSSQREGNRVFMPYETLPGEQMLYDWSEYRIAFGAELVRVYVHLLELGWSRYKVLSASVSIKQVDVFEAMEDSFIELGGVASRIQIDNARVFVDDSSVSNFQWNRRFLEFLGFYGINPSRSLPGHPWSKGKVERPFSYLEDHFINNRRFSSFENFYEQLKLFESEWNRRVHGVKGKAPLELFEEERSKLLELPRSPRTGEYLRFVGYQEESRRVTRDCLIAYGGNRYSVPYLYAGKDVWVRVSRGFKLLIFSQVGKLISVHNLRPGRGHVVIDKDHYRGYIRGQDRESFLVVSERLRERFRGYERVEEFLLGAKLQRKTNQNYNLSMIGRLFEDFSDDDCIRAMEESLRYKCFSYAFVKGFLSAHAKVMVEFNSSLSLKCFSSLGGELKRDLTEYRI